MNIIKNLEITDTAYGGYGVGRAPDGRVLFVPHTVEGDNADVVITDDKKQFAYAKLVNLNTESPLRITPVCPYAGECGGCLFAHIDANAQLDIKKRIIKNAFRKYDAPFPEIAVHTSNTEGYRIRATLRLKDGAAGFFAFKSNDFIKVKNCRIIKPSLFAKMNEFSQANNLTGELYAIETPEGASLATLQTDSCATSVKKTDIFDGISVGKRGYGLRSIGYNTEYGAVGIGRDTFFQANGFLMDSFQKRAVSLMSGGLSVVELYAGAGFFTCGLMKTAANVEACETSQDAVNLAKYYGYPVRMADAGAFLAQMKSADVIFLDPPRDGVSNKVIENIKRLNPFHIIYVSCSPSTLARDVMKLSPAYTIDTFDMFDMFPDTYHVESVVRLVKRSSK